MAASKGPEPKYGEKAEVSEPSFDDVQIKYVTTQLADLEAHTQTRQSFTVLGIITWLAVGVPVVIVAWKIALGW